MITTMKTAISMRIQVPLVVALLAIVTVHYEASAQGTLFNYQGRLTDNGAPANGSYDVKFTIYDAATGGSALVNSITNASLTVSNGLFTAALDFGAGIFTGADRWLELGVRTNGGGAFATLDPRQQVTPTPYAIFAGTASNATVAASLPASGIVGTVPQANLPGNLALLNSNAPFAGVVSATGFSGNGAGLTNLNAVARTGDTMTGKLNLPPYGLAVGTGQLVIAPTNPPDSGSLGVGIGTANPQALLHLSDSLNGRQARLRIENTGPFSGASLELKTPAAGNDWTLGAFENGSGAADGLFISDAGNTYFSIKADSGNVGIGTTTPSQKLEVNGAVQAGSFIGSGAGINNLSASNLTGTIPVANLSSNVAILNGNASFGGTVSANTFSGNGKGLTSISTAALVTHNFSLIGWGAGPQMGPPNLRDAAAIAVGGFHALAARADGTVVAWGANMPGLTNVPIGLSNVTALAAGNEFSVALKGNGTIAAWGANQYGELGISNVNGAASVAAGYYHALALRSNATVVAMGANGNGQAIVPADLTNAVAVAAGGYHSLALRSDGTISAWGWNFYGQASVPPGLSNVIAIGAGYGHSVAVKNDGTVAAWGWNISGQTNVPAGLSNVIAVACGDYQSVALKNDGTVAFWGAQYQPVPAGLSNVVRIAAGGVFNLALVDTGVAAQIAYLDQPNSFSSSNYFASLGGGSANISGTVSAGGFSGNGSGVSNVNAASLNGLTASNFWKLGGNTGTTPGTNFLGTTDDQPLELRVSGLRALRLEPKTNGGPNLIGGYFRNFVGESIVGATIAGGGGAPNGPGVFSNTVSVSYGTIGGGYGNFSSGSASTIAGGVKNQASGDVSFIGGGQECFASGSQATVAGGYGNTAGANYSTVGGGQYNYAGGVYSMSSGGYANSASGAYAAIGGGYANSASGNYAAVGGGIFNTAQGPEATVGGGIANQATDYYATVPGGQNNVAGGQNSFAAGQRAKALHQGSFVWADSAAADFTSTASDQFLIRAGGGVGIGKANPATALDVNGAVTATSFSGNGGSLTNLNASQVASGTLSLAQLPASVVTNNAASLTLNGTFSGNGSGLTNLNTPTTGDFVHSYSVTTQAVVTASIFQDITNQIDAQINGWLHTPGAVSYTNGQSGLYLIQYTAEATATSSTVSTISLRAVVNGTETADSQSTAVANTANQIVPISKSFMANLNAGDVLKFQFAGSSTINRLVSNSGLGTTRPSFSCTIIRIQ